MQKTSEHVSHHCRQISIIIIIAKQITLSIEIEYLPELQSSSFVLRLDMHRKVYSEST